jgi:hypothetical protein
VAHDIYIKKSKSVLVFYKNTTAAQVIYGKLYNIIVVRFIITVLLQYIIIHSTQYRRLVEELKVDMSSNWKEILRAQEEDLQRMEEMDAALNDDQNDLEENISSILKSTNSRIRQPKPSIREEDDDYSKYMKSANTERGGSKYNVKLDMAGMGIEDNEDDDDDDVMISSRSESMLSPSARSRGSPSGKISAKQAPDTAARIQKAKIKALTKQLEDTKDLRKQLLEQVNDLQKQLKNERDDNKQLRKR